MTAPDDPRTEPTSRLPSATPVRNWLADASARDSAAHRQIRLALFGEVEDIERFKLLRQIGRGGMGVVYAAWDPKLRRTVALKLLQPKDERDSDEATRRLTQEAQALARFTHPNVVHVYDVGVSRGRVFLAMEFVDGRTLRAWWSESPRRWNEVFDVMFEAGRGLAAAHEAGLVHRDFKPDNVLVDRGGRARVVDFGLAGLLRVPREPSTLSGIDEPFLGRQRTSSVGPVTDAWSGVVVGTPSYMPPEAFSGGVVDGPAGDQYAFCVSFFECLSGSLPFPPGVTTPSLERKRSGRLARPDTVGGVPGWLLRILDRGLSPDPRARFPSMNALLETLHRRRAAARQRQWSIAGVMSLGIALAIGGFVGASRSSEVVGAACARVTQSMDATWNETERRELAASFVHAEPARGGEVWGRSESLVQRWVDAWRAAALELCEASRVTRTLSDSLYDQSMRCLERHRAGLQARLDLLREADVAMVDDAVDAVLGLPAVASCQHVDVLLTRQALPTDPQMVAEIRDVELELELVQAAASLGRSEQARPTTEALALRAEATGYHPVHASALVSLGNLRRLEGDHAAALADFKRAIWVAERGRDDHTRGRAWNALLALVVWDTEDYAAADAWAPFAEATMERVGEPELRAEFANVMGILHYQRSDVVAARRQFELAYAEASRWRGADHPANEDIVANLGAIALFESRYDDAIDLWKRAMELSGRLYGPDSASLAILHSNIGTALSHQGRLVEAERHYRDALTQLERVHGPLHRNVGQAHGNLGSLLTAAGKLDEALEHQRKALEILARVVDPDHSQIAQAHFELGRLYMRMDRYADARAEFVLSRELSVRHTGIRASGMQARRGEISARQALGDLEGALEVLDDYLLDVETDKERLGLDEVTRAYLLAGELLLAAGRVGEARRQLDQARRVPHSTALIDAELDLLEAKILFAEGPGSRTRGLELARAVLVRSEGLAEGGEQLGREVQQWLAAHDQQPPQ